MFGTRMTFRGWCGFASILLAVGKLTSCSAKEYAPGETVKIWADRIGPMANPVESYPFTDLPLCELWQAAGAESRELSFSEALMGHRFVLSPRIVVQFPVETPPPFPKNESEAMVAELIDSDKTTICRMKFTAAVVELLTSLVTEQYWAEYEIDGLDVLSFIGKTETVDPITNQTVDISNTTVAFVTRPYIYTHRTLIFEKNKNQIIAVNMIPSAPQLLEVGGVAKLSYSTLWYETDVPYESRLRRLETSPVSVQKVHWFAIINSCIFGVVLYAVVVSLSMRTFGNSAVSSSSASPFGDVEAASLRFEESGWKLITTEVFRKPKHLSVLAVVYGTGWQLVATSLGVLGCAAYRSYIGYYPFVNPMTICCWYCLSQPVNGYLGTTLFRAYGGRRLTRTAIWMFLALPLFCFFIFLQINTTATALGSSLAVSQDRILQLVGLLLVSGMTLHPLGVYIGKQMSTKNLSSKFKQQKQYSLSRPIPQTAPWLRPLLYTCCSLAPAACLILEIHFLLNSFWGYHFYYPYILLFPIFILYECIVCCLTIVSVCALLNAEDYRWQWYSLQFGSSSALPLFGYAIYYYAALTHMTGFFQTLTYFSLSICVCVALGLASASLAYFSSYWFISQLYSGQKND